MHLLQLHMEWVSLVLMIITKKISSLSPLNPYAIYKNKFDKWILSNINKPPTCVGLKFLMFTVQMNIINQEWLQ